MTPQAENFTEGIESPVRSYVADSKKSGSLPDLYDGLWTSEELFDETGKSVYNLLNKSFFDILNDPKKSAMWKIKM